MSALDTAPARAGRAAELLLIGAWAALLGAVLAAPFVRASADAGDDLTRHTARVALLGWGAAAALLLAMPAGERGARTLRARLARWLWTLGWGSYMVHLGMAFHHYHGWSHAEAVGHVERASGFGPGIFVSHLFTLVWSLDVAWWWLAPAGYARRPAWVDVAVHGFLAFVVLNATVVFESGTIRWAGAALLTALAGLLALRLRRAHPHPSRRPAP